jgi:ribosomal protein S6E (S10)
MNKDTYYSDPGTTDVRQGDRRRMNLRVLLISSAIIVVVFALLYFFAYPFGSPGN